jgi:hypothetical protein
MIFEEVLKMDVHQSMFERTFYSIEGIEHALTAVDFSNSVKNHPILVKFAEVFNIDEL